MERLLFLLGLVGALLIPGLGWSADGDQCKDSSGDPIPLFNKGTWIAITCIQLCDNYVGTDSSCDEWDFNDTPGMPDIVVFEYEDIGGDCAATPDFTLGTGPISGGTPSYDSDDSAVVLNSTTDRVLLITKDFPLDRFLFTSVADDTDCTNIDIRMFFYNQKS